MIERKNVDKFSKVVSREEIRSNAYNLNIPRYVDSSKNQKLGMCTHPCLEEYL